MPINAKDETVIASISRAHVEATFFGLRRFIKGAQWIGKTNRYSIDTIEKIKSDIKAGGIHNPRQLAQYIVASSLLHSTDGWSYLGKAILSLLRGDPHRSRHLAYYAELRAAMAILATEGVGVFDKRHIAINGPNSVVPLQQEVPTHVFVWECLRFWSALPKSSDLFVDIIRPHGRSLDDWFAPFGGGTTVTAQARDWLLCWGMDLKSAVTDKNARNESSYRPDGMSNSWHVNCDNALSFVEDVWRVLEPSSDGEFSVLDRCLLRLSIESVARGLGGRGKKQLATRESVVSRIVGRQGLSNEMEQHWIRFLLRQSSPDDPPLFGLTRVSAFDEDFGHISVIARAVLLLRLASGATGRLLKQADLAIDSVSFWWSRLGYTRGLWEGTRELSATTDLWADVTELLVDAQNFRRRHASAGQNFFKAGEELGHVLLGLSGCERAAIWSMTP